MNTNYEREYIIETLQRGIAYLECCNSQSGKELIGIYKSVLEELTQTPTAKISSETLDRLNACSSKCVNATGIVQTICMILN